MKNKMLLTPEQEDFLKEFSGLPPVIARKEVEHFLGGLVARKTLANADARGEGPEVAWAVGRNVAYRTRSLLEWVLRNFEIRRLASADVRPDSRAGRRAGRRAVQEETDAMLARQSSRKHRAACL